VFDEHAEALAVHDTRPATSADASALDRATDVDSRASSTDGSAVWCPAGTVTFAVRSASIVAVTVRTRARIDGFTVRLASIAVFRPARERCPSVGSIATHCTDVAITDAPTVRFAVRLGCVAVRASPCADGVDPIALCAEALTRRPRPGGAAIRAVAHAGSTIIAIRGGANGPTRCIDCQPSTSGTLGW